MMDAVRSAKMIAARYRCNVILIHHFGKDEARGSRGSKVFEDAADVVIYLKKKNDAVYATMKNNRFGRDGYTVAFDDRRYSGQAEGAPDAYVDVPVLVYRGVIEGKPLNHVQRNIRANLEEIIGKLDELSATDEDTGIPRDALARHLVGPLREDADAKERTRWETAVGRWQKILIEIVRAKPGRKGKSVAAPARGLFMHVGALPPNAQRDTRPVIWFKPKHYKLPNLSEEVEDDGGDE